MNALLMYRPFDVPAPLQALAWRFLGINLSWHMREPPMTVQWHLVESLIDLRQHYGDVTQLHTPPVRELIQLKYKAQCKIAVLTWKTVRMYVDTTKGFIDLYSIDPSVPRLKWTMRVYGPDQYILATAQNVLGSQDPNDLDDNDLPPRGNFLVHNGRRERLPQNGVLLTRLTKTNGEFSLRYEWDQRSFWTQKEQTYADGAVAVAKASVIPPNPWVSWFKRHGRVYKECLVPGHPLIISQSKQEKSMQFLSLANPGSQQAKVCAILEPFMPYNYLDQWLSQQEDEPYFKQCSASRNFLLELFTDPKFHHEHQQRSRDLLHVVLEYAFEDYHPTLTIDLTEIVGFSKCTVCHPTKSKSPTSRSLLREAIIQPGNPNLALHGIVSEYLLSRGKSVHEWETLFFQQKHCVLGSTPADLRTIRDGTSISYLEFFNLCDRTVQFQLNDLTLRPALPKVFMVVSKMESRSMWMRRASNISRESQSFFKKNSVLLDADSDDDDAQDHDPVPMVIPLPEQQQQQHIVMHDLSNDLPIALAVESEFESEEIDRDDSSESEEDEDWGPRYTPETYEYLDINDKVIIITEDKNATVAMRGSVPTVTVTITKMNDSVRVEPPKEGQPHALIEEQIEGAAREGADDRNTLRCRVVPRKDLHAQRIGAFLIRIRQFLGGIASGFLTMDEKRYVVQKMLRYVCRLRFPLAQDVPTFLRVVVRKLTQLLSEGAIVPRYFQRWGKKIQDALNNPENKLKEKEEKEIIVVQGPPYPPYEFPHHLARNQPKHFLHRGRNSTAIDMCITFPLIPVNQHGIFAKPSEKWTVLRRHAATGLRQRWKWFGDWLNLGQHVQYTKTFGAKAETEQLLSEITFGHKPFWLHPKKWHFGELLDRLAYMANQPWISQLGGCPSKPQLEPPVRPSNGVGGFAPKVQQPFTNRNERIYSQHTTLATDTKQVQVAKDGKTLFAQDKKKNLATINALEAPIASPSARAVIVYKSAQLYLESRRSFSDFDKYLANILKPLSAVRLAYLDPAIMSLSSLVISYLRWMPLRRNVNNETIWERQDEWCILMLEVPLGAQRVLLICPTFWSTMRKERSDKVIPRQIQLPDPHQEREYSYPGYTLTGEEDRPIKAISGVHLNRYDPPVIYEVDKLVTVPVLDGDRDFECAPGIHFYPERAPAFYWIQGMKHFASSAFLPPRAAPIPTKATAATATASASSASK